MGFLVAAVFSLAALCIVNLLLSFGLVRSLRRHIDQSSHSTGANSARTMLPAGTYAPEFTADSVDDQEVTLSNLIGSRSVLGFFSAGCGPCRTPLPEFVAYASTIPGGATQVVAFISGDPAEATDIIETVRDHATIVLEGPLGSVAAAYSVNAFPTFYTLDENGKIISGGPTIRHMTAELV